MATRLYISNNATPEELDTAYGLPAGSTQAARDWDATNPAPAWNAPRTNRNPDPGYAHYEARIAAGHDAAHHCQTFGFGRFCCTIQPKDFDPVCGSADGVRAEFLLRQHFILRGEGEPTAAQLAIARTRGICWS